MDLSARAFSPTYYLFIWICLITILVIWQRRRVEPCLHYWCEVYIYIYIYTYMCACMNKNFFARRDQRKRRQTHQTQGSDCNKPQSALLHFSCVCSSFIMQEEEEWMFICTGLFFLPSQHCGCTFQAQTRSALNLHPWCRLQMQHLMLHSVCILCSQAGQWGPGAAQLTRLTSAYNIAQPF